MKRVLALTLLVFFMFCSTWSIAPALAEEPRVRVETYPHWTAGDIAIYLMDFPSDGATYSSDTIRIRVAVWGVTPQNPVKILLNGEEAARIEGPGMFTYEWSLRGSYHLLIRCETKIFQQAAFNVKAPPPPLPVILLDEFYARLEQQRSSMMLAMVGATMVGVPVGIWFKKKTKVTTAWATMPMGVAVLIGVRWLPDYYMLIPFGLSAGMVYWLARGYATEKALVEVHEGGLIRVNTVPFDDTGNRVIADVGPRHFRTGFIHTKPVEWEGKQSLGQLEFNGEVYPSIVVREAGVKETEDKVTVETSYSMAQALSDSKIIDKLQVEVSESRVAKMLVERALPVVITQIMQDFERMMRESLLDRAIDAQELRGRVQDATKKLMAELQKLIPPSPPAEAEEPGEESHGEG